MRSRYEIKIDVVREMRTKSDYSKHFTDKRSTKKKKTNYDLILKHPMCCTDSFESACNN